jgi:hypothetical protein
MKAKRRPALPDAVPIPPFELFEGRVTAVSAATVEAVLGLNEAIEARCPAHIDRSWLAAAVAVAPVEAAFATPRNGGRAILFAIFPGPEHSDIRADITLVGRRVRIEGEEIRVQGKKAHVAVTRDGGVELRGKDVTSRATRINRLQGGAVRLN